jgi:phosphohistidine swiveling domain-containing protein
MPGLATLTTNKAVGILATESGVPARLAEIALELNVAAPAFAGSQVIAQNVPADIAERAIGAKYPSISVFCAKLTNLLREKFRRFSGRAQMVAEIRVSQDRLEGLDAQTQLYTDAVSATLDAARGDWGDGVFYGGGYEITYGPVKAGGRNFLQTAKVTFDVEISSN